MKKYISARGVKLLEEIEKVPYTDTCDDDKLDLILAAMREVSVEMFQQAARKSRNEIAGIKAKAHADDVEEAAQAREEKIRKAGFDSKPKIQLSSSVIRRVDNH